MQNEETDEIPFVVVVDISLASSSRTTERVPTKAQSLSAGDYRLVSFATNSL